MNLLSSNSDRVWFDSFIIFQLFECSVPFTPAVLLKTSVFFISKTTKSTWCLSGVVSSSTHHLNSITSFTQNWRKNTPQLSINYFLTKKHSQSFVKIKVQLWIVFENDEEYRSQKITAIGQRAKNRSWIQSKFGFI